MTDRPTSGELRSRIQADETFFHGTLPDRTAIAWRAYLTALMEWGLTSVDDHDRLCGMLPAVNPETVTGGHHPTFDDLKGRVQADVSRFGAKLPELLAIAWYGYLAALIEWGLISVSEYDRICDLLPPVEDNPAAAILLGRDQ